MKIKEYLCLFLALFYAYTQDPENIIKQTDNNYTLTIEKREKQVYIQVQYITNQGTSICEKTLTEQQIQQLPLILSINHLFGVFENKRSYSVMNNGKKIEVYSTLVIDGNNYIQTTQIYLKEVEASSLKIQTTNEQLKEQIVSELQAYFQTELQRLVSLKTQDVKNDLDKEIIRLKTQNREIRQSLENKIQELDNKYDENYIKSVEEMVQKQTQDLMKSVKKVEDWLHVEVNKLNQRVSLMNKNLIKNSNKISSLQDQLSQLKTQIKKNQNINPQPTSSVAQLTNIQNQINSLKRNINDLKKDISTLEFNDRTHEKDIKQLENSLGNNNINNGNSRSSSGGENNRIISNSNEIKILKNEVKLNKLHTEGEIKNILRLYNDIRIKVNNNEEDIVEIVQLLNKNPSTLNRPSTSSTSTDDSDVLELIYKIDDKIDQITNFFNSLSKQITNIQDKHNRDFRSLNNIINNLQSGNSQINSLQSQIDRIFSSTRSIISDLNRLERDIQNNQCLKNCQRNSTQSTQSSPTSPTPTTSTTKTVPSAITPPVDGFWNQRTIYAKYFKIQGNTAEYTGQFGVATQLLMNFILPQNQKVVISCEYLSSFTTISFGVLNKERSVFKSSCNGFGPCIAKNGGITVRYELELTQTHRWIRDLNGGASIGTQIEGARQFVPFVEMKFTGDKVRCIRE